MFKKDAVNVLNDDSSKKVYITRIIISVPVFMLAAFLYLAFTPAKYEVSARVAVRGQQPLEILNDIKSKKLIGGVISKLQLTVSYYKDVVFKKRELYGDSLAVRFILLSGINAPAEITVKILSNDEYEINRDDTLEDVAFNKPETYSFARFTVVKGPAFKINGKPMIVKFNSEGSVVKDFERNLDAKGVKNKEGYIDLSIKTNSIAKGKDFLKVLGNALSAVENKPVFLAAKNNNTDKLDLLNGQLHALQIKAAGLRKRQVLLANNKKEHTVSVKRNYTQKSLQEQVLEVIKPYADANVVQFVQIPYSNEISDKNLASLVNNFNQLQIDKQRALLGASNTNKVIPGYNAQLGKLKANMVQRINEDLENMHRSPVLANSTTSVAGNMLDSINTIDKLVKSKELEYRHYLFNKPAFVNPVNPTIDKESIINTEQPVAIYPKKAYIFILALFAGLTLPVIFSYLLFYIRFRFFQKV